MENHRRDKTLALKMHEYYSMKDDRLQIANQDNNPFFSLVAKAEEKPSTPEDKVPLSDKTSPFMFSFLPDLVNCIKNTLISINNYLLLPIEELSDAEFRAHSQSAVREDIKKTELILNSLLNYISINTPIMKTNTMFIILEEIFEANQKQIEDKKIKVLKDYGKDLPETLMHTEQVRFILNSLIQCALVSSPVNGNIRFVMKYVGSQKELVDKTISMESKGGYVAVVISFTRDQKAAEPLENGSAAQNGQKEAPVNLILKLVNESIQKNHGVMKIEAEEEPPRTHIRLKLNIERRKAVYYEPIKF